MLPELQDDDCRCPILAPSGHVKHINLQRNQRIESRHWYVLARVDIGCLYYRVLGQTLLIRQPRLHKTRCHRRRFSPEQHTESQQSHGDNHERTPPNYLSLCVNGHIADEHVTCCWRSSDADAVVDGDADDGDGDGDGCCYRIPVIVLVQDGRC